MVSSDLDDWPCWVRRDWFGIYLCVMIPDPLKDLTQLKNLFPDMEEYVPPAGEEKPAQDIPSISDK